MTTINPMRPFGTSGVIVRSDINNAWTYMGAAGHYKTADVLAALGAVPRAELAEVKREAGYAEMGADEWRQRAEAAEAKLTAIRDIVYDADQILTGPTWQRIREALNPTPKPFKLPTEAGVEFDATNGVGERARFCSVWNTFKGGESVAYVNECNYVYTGKDVMSLFTDHRLVGEA